MDSSGIAALGALALSLLTLIGSGLSWLSGARRREAQADAASIDNISKLSTRLTELENERETDYEERQQLRRKMWRLERDYEILKRQNERLRADVLLLVKQIRDEGMEPAVVPEDYEE